MGGGSVSDRLFVEGRLGRDFQQSAHVLMQELDDEAKARGYHVVGAVTISTYDHDLLGGMMRLEADVEPGVRVDSR